MILRVIIILTAFMASAYGIKAQPYPSVGSRFEVDEKTGCAPFTVNVTIRAPFVCNGSNPCDMDFEGNDNFQSLTFSHTYSQPGTYTLKIVFQTSGIDQITITVLPNIQPDFDIYSCGNNEVQVKVNDTNYNQYVINYNDGTEVVVPSGSLAKSNHAYGTSGNKTISVRGRNLSADDNCNPMIKTVNALALLPAPTITQLTVLDNAQIRLDFDNEQNILYKLEIGTNNAGSFQQMQNIYNTTTATVSNLRTDDNYYCFRLGAFDPCNNITTYSNIICSANFDITAQNNLNRLNWSTAATGVSNFSILKNAEAPLTAAAPATVYNDADIRCGTNYCYQLFSNYTNGSRSISAQKCVTAISTDIPAAIQNITTVVDQNSVALQWQQDPAYTAAEYAIVKSVNGSFSPLGTAATPAYTDNAYNTETTSCYTISYSDVCGNKSPSSTEVCPIRLSASLQSNNTVALTWTPFNGWINGVRNYVVEKYNTQGQLLLSIDAAAATSLLDESEDLTNQVYLYRITAYANDAGLVASVSNTVTIIKEPNLFYPTAFTPNGDGLNDIFLVFGQYTATFEMKIFNRWGELMYITNDLTQGWNGTYKGNLMPEGTYVFTAKLTDLAGRTFERSGTVLLLKKK